MFTHSTSLTHVDLTSAIIRDPLVVSPETPVIAAIAQMSRVRGLCQIGATSESDIDQVAIEARSSCILVTTGNHLVGILTEQDVVRLITQQQPLDQLQLEAVMTRNVVTLPKTEFTDLWQATHLLQQHHIRHLPILDEDNQLVGLVTYESLCRTCQSIALLRLQQVAEVMTTEVVCADPTVVMLDIARLLDTHRVSSVVIVQTQPQQDGATPLQRPIGIVTAGDVVQCQALGWNLNTAPAQVGMSQPVFAVTPEDSLLSMQQLMAQHQVQRLAVTNPQGELVGIVTQSSLLKGLHPFRVFQLAEVLEARISRLEAENRNLLATRTLELETQVQERTIALTAQAEQAEQERLIATITTQIRASLDLQTILKTTVEQVRLRLRCDRVTIWQVDTNWQFVAVAESTQLPQSLLGEQVLDRCFDQSQAKLYRQGHVRVVPDIYTTAMADCHRELLLRLQIRAKILVPLLCQHQLWGFLCVTESQHPRAWQPEEIELLQALSVQLAIALQQSITHQQLQTELATRQQRESQFQQLATTLPGILYTGIQTPDGVRSFTYINALASEVFELDPAAILADANVVFDLFHPDDRAGYEQAVAASVATLDPFHYEWRIITPSGKTKWLQVDSQPEQLPNQDILWFGVALEITDRKQVALALAESERQLSTLIGNLPGYVYRVCNDPDYTPIFLSSGVTAITGYHLNEYLIERTISCGQEMHPDDVDRVWAIVQQALGDRAPYECEYRLFTKTGEEKWVWERGLGIYSEENELLFLEGFVTEITARKQAEQELQNLIEGTAATTGENFFPALVQHIACTLKVAYAVITEYKDEQLQMLAFWANGALQPTFSYHPAHTPCERTLQEGCFYCEHSVQESFPNDLDLAEMAAESYLGVALRNANGSAIGNLCVLDHHPIQDAARAEKILHVFAARTAAELERQQATEALEQLNQDLEVIVAERTTALHEREAQLRDFFDNANDLIQSMLLDNGHFEYVNRAWRDTLGYTAAEVEQLTIFDVLHPAYHNHCQSLIEQMRSGTICILDRMELVFLTKDQREIQVEGSLNCRVEGDRPVATRAIFRDMTERNQIEAALRKSETELRGLFQAMDDLVLVFDREGTYLEITASKQDKLYQPAHRLLGANLHSIFPPHRASFFLDIIQDTLETRTTQECEYSLLIDGENLWFSVKSSPLTADSVIWVVRDTTPHKHSEMLLQEREARYRAVMDHASDAIVLADSQGHIVEFNRKAEELLGYSQAEARQLHVSQIHPPEVLEAVHQHFSGIVVHDYGPSFETLIIRQDGTPIPVDITGSRIELNGEIYAQGIFRDIRDRKQAELALQKTTEELDRFFSLALEMLCIANTDGYFIRLNHQWENVLGYSIADLEGSRFLDYVHPDDLADTFEAIAQLTEGQKIVGFINRYRCQDGSYRWLDWHSVPSGQLVYAAARDITGRIRAEQETRQLTERERLLREITQRIRQSLDLQTIFDTACQEIQQVLRSDRVGIFKFYPESHFDAGEFVAEAVVEGYPSVVAIRVHDHCFGANYSELYVQGRYYAVADIYHHGMESCHTDILAQFQVQASLVMPLLCGNQLWGLLCIHQCCETREWQQAEIDLSLQLSNQLAIAIQQATLYEQVQSELQVRQQAEARIAQQLRQQKTLGSISQQIRETLDLNEILRTVSHQVKDILQGDRVIVFRLYADGRSQIVEEVVTADLPRLKDQHWDDEVWAQDILDCYWQGQPRIVPDVMTDIWTDCLVDYSRAGQIQSKIVAPILQEVQYRENHRWVAPGRTNKLWGILVIHACHHKRVWHDSEAQLLQQIANQLAISIQQTSFFEQLQQELTERQQAEQQLTISNQELALSNQELARATRLKDEFLANMSHELRTPLNAILGMTEGLQEEIFGRINAQQLRSLNTMETSANHLLSLINDILDVAKIESGQIELEYTSVAVAPLCSSSLAFIKQQALKKSIQLETNLPPHLPSLLIDERRVRQVLLNLLTNAVKFTPEGGRITLTVSQVEPSPQSLQKYLRITITDTGIGIAAENIPKLFRPFVQIDSALNRKYTGTGLGLALVKQIVELHGGQVGLTSELGVGSCFTIELPCDPDTLLDGSPNASNATQTPVAPLTPDLAAATTAPLILLAEDNEANISTMTSYLEAKGYRMLLAHDGAEAIALAQTALPDLILMDIQMPGMDGLEAMRQIRQSPHLSHVPIIALTALAMAGDRERCLAAGANDYLAKPVRLKQLAMLIQSLLPS